MTYMTERQSARISKTYKWRLNPVWHGILYSRSRMATAGVKGLTVQHFYLRTWYFRQGPPPFQCTWESDRPLDQSDVHLCSKNNKDQSNLGTSDIATSDKRHRSALVDDIFCHVMPWPPSWVWIEPEIYPIRRPRKPYPRTKHEMDRITRCKHMAIRIFQDGGRLPSWIWSTRK